MSDSPNQGLIDVLRQNGVSAVKPVEWEFSFYLDDKSRLNELTSLLTSQGYEPQVFIDPEEETEGIPPSITVKKNLMLRALMLDQTLNALNETLAQFDTYVDDFGVLLNQPLEENLSVPSPKVSFFGKLLDIFSRERKRP